MRAGGRARPREDIPAGTGGEATEQGGGLDVGEAWLAEGMLTRKDVAWSVWEQP